MWLGVVGTTLRGWVSVDDGRGEPRGSLPPGAFTTTVVAPDDSASITATVAESSQTSGLYYFDVPGSFFVTYGPGEYAVQIVIDVMAPPFNAVACRLVKVTQQDLDAIVADLEAAHGAGSWTTATGFATATTAATILTRVTDLWTYGSLDPDDPFTYPTYDTAGGNNAMTRTLVLNPDGTVTATRG